MPPPPPAPSGFRFARVPDPSELLRVELVLRSVPLAALARLELCAVLVLALALLCRPRCVGRDVGRVLVQRLPPEAPREGFHRVEAESRADPHQAHVRQVPSLIVARGHHLVVPEPHAEEIIQTVSENPDTLYRGGKKSRKRKIKKTKRSKKSKTKKNKL